MQVSPTTAAHVARSLGDVVDLILDGGPTEVGIESTVVDLRGPKAAILRPGMVGAAELEPHVGPLAAPNERTGEMARPSPGMLDRHYAPHARVILFAAEAWPEVEDQIDDVAAAGERVGVMVMTVDPPRFTALERMPNDAAGYAKRLYAALHAMDAARCDVIYIERVPADVSWLGVRDRLERASR